MASDAITQVAAAVPLVDHHVHGFFSADPTREQFENALNEGNTEPLAAFTSGFDSQLGFAVRAWCAEPLDLPRHVDADSYWARRSELGEAEVAKRLLPLCGVSEWLVDTGFGPGKVTGPEELEAFSGAPAREISRLEALAERLIVETDGGEDYAARFRTALAGQTEIVGVKTVLAYRGGFDRPLSRPSDAEVAAAALAWRDQVDQGAVARLENDALLRFGIYAAVDQGLPIQFHVGFGDRDLSLDRADPLHLLDFLREPDVAAVPILLLHCYPFERNAGYLAQAFNNVYLDVGASTHYLGANATGLLSRSLEMAPFSKILFSSDAWGPSELHFLGAKLWRKGMGRILSSWVEDDEWGAADAERVLGMIASGNAERVYSLGR